MVTYVINRTDVNAVDRPTINVDEKTVNQEFPIALFGREKLEYGELMNENILHLLENFACPEDVVNNPGNPLLSTDPLSELGALENTLQNAIDGQLWYNKTNELLYLRVDGVWVPLSMFNEIAANYGTIAHGENLPLPVSSTGATFTYEECSWMVSPYNYPEEIDLMRCSTTTDDAQVIMQYSTLGSSGMVSGVANYMIIGIRGNVNLGDNDAVAPPQLSPTATPNPTVTPTGTFGVTSTVTPTVTPTSTVTPTVTPTQAATPAQTPPNSVTLLGANTRLYLHPSPGYTADLSPTSRDHYPNTCGDLRNPAQVPEPADTYWYLYYYEAIEPVGWLQLNNISGGTPPYTVDFTGVTVGVTSNSRSFLQISGDGNLYNLPGVHASLHWYGGSGTSTNDPIKTGVLSGANARMRIDHAADDHWNGWGQLDTHSYLGMYIEFWGVVNVKDQSGQSRDWWITSTCPVGGTNVNTPPAAPLPVFNSTWNHYYSCGQCTGTCVSTLNIII